MLPVYLLTAEQIEIQKLARDFANRQIAPKLQLCESHSCLDSDLLEKICQSGLVNTRIPDQFGGLSLSLIETCLILEEFAFVCSGISSAAEASELAISYLLQFGSQDQQRQYLSVLTAENGLAGIALPNSYAMSTEDKIRAEVHNNSILVNGYCPIVLNASFAKWFIITCPLIVKDNDRESKKGLPGQLAYFIIPRDAVGLEVADPVPLLGRRATDARALRFTNVELESIAIIYTQSLLSSIDNTLDIGLAVNAPIIASGCLGLASAAFKHAKNYAQQRETFGVPISKHQSLAFMIADMSADIESVRMMIYAAIESVNAGANNLKIAISTLSLALEMVTHVSNDAVQIFGGYGYTKDYPAEKLMRDAKSYQLFYENDKKEYLARNLLKN